LNINTITSSNTMFARRVFELILCNTLVLSNYSKGMYNLFGDNIVVISNEKIDLKDANKKQRDNLYNVLKNHTYTNRFKQILDTINYEYLPEDKTTTIYYEVKLESDMDSIIEHYELITYKPKKLVLILSNEIHHLINKFYRKYSNTEVSVCSINYFLNPANKIINDSPYFILATPQLKEDFIEKAILHYSYIEPKFGIALGNKFIFKQIKNVDNVLFANENFEQAIKNTLKAEPTKLPVYTIQI